MKIYSMTATFGKLEHQTLKLEPGLNIIERPNEWGKSTWCAFLVNMLYGVDNTERNSKTGGLADKNRYKPWSGAAMSGRIDLNWNGRDITIERQTTGRVIFGDFNAYETTTGLPVTELNATNCGQMLLGVERSVFTRAGFLKLADLPVTQDDALRRRLNNLVTTGDESGAGDKLGSTLRDLRNKCRHNATGLLPKAEAERMQLENQLNELIGLQQDIVLLKRQNGQKEADLAKLQNHKAALDYAASLADARKVSDAEAALTKAKAECDVRAAACEGLPELDEAQQILRNGQALQQAKMQLQAENQHAPALPEAPAITPCFRDLAPREAVEKAKADHAVYTALEEKQKKISSRLWIGYVLGVVLALGLAGAGFLLMPALYIAAGGVLVASIGGTMALGRSKKQRIRKETAALTDKYPGMNPNEWVTEAEKYLADQESYQRAVDAVKAQRLDLDRRIKENEEQIAAYTKGEDLNTCLDRKSQAVTDRNALAIAQRELQQAEHLASSLRSMLKILPKPQQEDTLTYSADQTDALIATASFELKQLHTKLGQYEGRTESLGQESVIRTQLKAVNRRISQLEDTYSALELALKALDRVTTSLQQRFAPRISKRAQELFAQMTGQRYDRLTLGSDLTVNASTADEAALRPAQQRSDGTIDQLYLALRLAVAEELTPNAPLVLDDALVRFDDTRLAAAMDILRKMGEDKQVILFTCQSRESRL